MKGHSLRLSSLGVRDSSVVEPAPRDTPYMAVLPLKHCYFSARNHGDRLVVLTFFKIKWKCKYSVYSVPLWSWRLLLELCSLSFHLDSWLGVCRSQWHTRIKYPWWWPRSRDAEKSPALTLISEFYLLNTNVSVWISAGHRNSCISLSSCRSSGGSRIWPRRFIRFSFIYLVNSSFIRM